MPGQSADAVAVIVLNWNNAADTIACVESLVRMRNDIAIFLVDNASTDGSVAAIREWAETDLPRWNEERAAEGRGRYVLDDEPEQSLDNNDGRAGAPPPLCLIRLIQTGANLGYAGGNNVGLRSAKRLGYAYFWILNNDTQVAPDALSHALDRMAADATVGLCGSTLVYLDAPDLVQCRGGGLFDRLTGRAGQIGGASHISDPIDGSAIERRMQYVSGAASLVQRAFLDEVGLMDEGYFLYFEELDWATRAKGKYRIAYAPASIVYHKVGGTVGTDDRGGEGSDLAVYYMTRSRIRFCLRHSRLSLPFVALDVTGSILSALLRGKRQHARVIAAAALRMALPPQPFANS